MTCVFLVRAIVLTDSPDFARDIREVSKEIGSALARIPNPETKWDEFATKLMGTDSKANGHISQITQRNIDFVDRCKALLECWKATAKQEPRWDLIVTVLTKIGLHGPARVLDRDITNLRTLRNSRQLPLEKVGHAHQPIPQASEEYLEGE